MSKITLNAITGGLGSKDLLNANFQEIALAFENTVSRDGSIPNSMNASLDMNNRSILNANVISANSIVIDDFNIAEQVEAAEASAIAAQEAETQALVNAGVAQAAQEAAEEAATNAESSLASVLGQKIVWTGAYNALTAYEPNDAFSFGGASYIVTASVTGVAPPDNAYYDVLAAQGSPGAGTGDMLAANNLSDVANAASARANLGLQIGVNVQAYDADIAKLDENANFTGTLQKGGVNVLLANAIGTTVQAYDADIPTVVPTLAEMQNGTQTARRSMSPADIKAAIDASTPEYIPSTALNGLYTYKIYDTTGLLTIGATSSAPGPGTWRIMGVGAPTTSGVGPDKQHYLAYRIA